MIKGGFQWIFLILGVFISMVGLPMPLQAQSIMPGAARLPEAPSKSCTPTLVFQDHLQTPAYDPFAQSALVSDSDIGFREADCEQSTTINTSIGWREISPRLSNNGSELAFSLFVAGRDLTTGDGGLSTADALRAGATIMLPPETSGNLSNIVRLVIREGQVVPPGHYTVEAPINTQIARQLITGDVNLTPESRFEASASVLRITTEVLAVMKLGISGCDVSGTQSSSTFYQGASFNLASSCKLALGDRQSGMLNGDIARGRLTSLTNVNFVIAMTSNNGGVLRTVGRASGTNEIEQIRYVASVESHGRAFEFTCSGPSCGQSHTFEPSASPLGTDVYFQVRIDEPNLNQKRAGTYSDIITLIIQPAS